MNIQLLKQNRLHYNTVLSNSQKWGRNGKKVLEHPFGRDDGSRNSFSKDTTILCKYIHLRSVFFYSFQELPLQARMNLLTNCSQENQCECFFLQQPKYNTAISKQNRNTYNSYSIHIRFNFQINALGLVIKHTQYHILALAFILK